MDRDDMESIQDVLKRTKQVEEAHLKEAIETHSRHVQRMYDFCKCFVEACDNLARAQYYHDESSRAARNVARELYLSKTGGHDEPDDEDQDEEGYFYMSDEHEC